MFSLTSAKLLYLLLTLPNYTVRVATLDYLPLYTRVHGSGTATYDTGLTGLTTWDCGIYTNCGGHLNRLVGISSAAQLSHS